MAGNLFPFNVLLEIRQKFNSKSFKHPKDKKRSKKPSSSSDEIEKNLSEVTCTTNKKNATISEHQQYRKSFDDIVGGTKNPLEDGQHYQFCERKEFSNKKVIFPTVTPIQCNSG